MRPPGQYGASSLVPLRELVTVSVRPGPGPGETLSPHLESASVPALPNYNRSPTKSVNTACKPSAVLADLRGHELPWISVRVAVEPVVETMRNGSQPPRSADRRLRVPEVGCPRRTPGEARRREFVFWFSGPSFACLWMDFSWISELRCETFKRCNQWAREFYRTKHPGPSARARLPSHQSCRLSQPPAVPVVEPLSRIRSLAPAASMPAPCTLTRDAYFACCEKTSGRASYS
jgi:hypothetical protein